MKVEDFCIDPILKVKRLTPVQKKFNWKDQQKLLAIAELESVIILINIKTFIFLLYDST